MRHWFSDVGAFRRDPLTFLIQRGTTATEPIVRLYLGPRPIYLMTDPALAKPFLKLSEDAAGKGWLLQKLRPILGNSFLLLNDPEEHRRRRDAVHRHMARGTVEGLAHQLAAEIRSTLVRLSNRATFNPLEITAPLAIRLMCIAVFGSQILTDADEAVLVHAVQLVEEDVAAEIFRVGPLFPWVARARARRRNEAKRAMALVVRRVRDRAAATSALRSLEALNLSEEDLCDELVTMLLAGHHTTGTTATWVLYFLATQPKLLEQISREAAEATGPDGEIDPDRLSGTKVTHATINEVLRLYPAAWWFSRELKAAMRFGGRELEKGASMLISPWLFQRDPRFWGDPTAFSTDRNYGSAAFLPFGFGPRTCVGMGLARLELQLLALEIAAAYRFAAVRPCPALLPKPLVTLVPQPMEMALQVREGRGMSRVAAE